jgi:hypothetical protein
MNQQQLQLIDYLREENRVLLLIVRGTAWVFFNVAVF